MAWADVVERSLFQKDRNSVAGGVSIWSYVG